MCLILFFIGCFLVFVLGFFDLGWNVYELVNGFLVFVLIRFVLR